MMLNGCATSSFVQGVYQNDHLSYRVGALGAAWHFVEQKRANVVFEHQSGDATIVVHSRCGVSKDESLEMLSKDLFLEQGSTEFLESKSFVLEGQPALRTVERYPKKIMTVVIDTVMVRRKDCAIWLQLVAKEARFTSIRAEFVSFFEGFSWLRGK